VLAVTAMPTRNSPVLRGKWVLANLLGTPPPPPPPDVPPLPDGAGVDQGQSMRERMAAHRRNPVCASCHNTIDPAGFALENFDTTGRWRELDESMKPVDASGMLPDGSKFSSVVEFREALLAHPERFLTALTEKLLIYALGRGLTPADMTVIRQVLRESQPSEYAFSSIILGIVKSIPFQMRGLQS
jgi:hypothetical protein